MTMFIRRLIQLALGLAAGLAAWPLMEALIHWEIHFAGYLVFSVVSGGLFGLIFGAFLGGAEGIIASRARRIAIGSAVGGVVGAGGGAVGFLVAQGILFVTGEYLIGNVRNLQRIGVPVARAVGWAVLGAFVGAAAGVQSFSLRKVGIGALGGFLGGFFGGAAVEYGRVFFPGFPLAHLVGLLLLGVLIGLAYAFVERRLSFGVFRVLNGPFKTREYILNQRRMIIGSRARCDIPLPSRARGAQRAPLGSSEYGTVRGYREVAEAHCRLVARGRDLFIEPIDGVVRVNDERIAGGTAPRSRADSADSSDESTRGARPEGKPLKFDDVVACGGVKFLYKRD